MLGTWIADAYHSARRLWAHPGYALLAVLTLALGIGGTTAAYGVARGVLFDPLPYPHANDLGMFWKKTDWTEEELLFIRGRVPGFGQVALYRQRDAIWREGDQAARLVPGVTASAELFDVLGAHPVLGRAFRAGDDVPGAEQVAVLSFDRARVQRRPARDRRGDRFRIAFLTMELAAKRIPGPSSGFGALE